MQGQIQEIGGGTPDLQRTPTTRIIRNEGATREQRPGRGRGEGAPPPLGGRGVPEDQTRRIVAHIINQLPGLIPPSDQSLEPPIR